MTKEARAYNEVNTVSSINGVGKIGQVQAKKIKLNNLLTPYPRINSKWIEDLSASHETINILKENIGSKILDISHSNIFANISPQARDTKGKNLKMSELIFYFIECEYMTWEKLPSKRMLERTSYQIRVSWGRA